MTLITCPLTVLSRRSTVELRIMSSNMLGRRISFGCNAQLTMSRATRLAGSAITCLHEHCQR